MSTAWQASDEEILHGLATIEKKTNLLRLEGLALVREAELRGLAGAHGYNTTNELLQCTQNITKAEARRRITTAKDVLPGRSPSGDALPAVLPETAKAFAEGSISADHVAVIQRTLGGLKPDLEPHRGELESYLAAHARVFNPYELGVLARRRLAFLDPDGAEPRDTPPTRDHLAFTANGDGFDLRGWLSTESAADLNTALSSLAAPQPAEDGTPDPRTKTERDGDALVDLARRSLTWGQLPVDGGERPHVNVTISLEDLESRLGAGLRDFGDGSMTGRRRDHPHRPRRQQRTTRYRPRPTGCTPLDAPRISPTRQRLRLPRLRSRSTMVLVASHRALGSRWHHCAQQSGVVVHASSPGDAQRRMGSHHH
ncbi:DUF222 domain-containing protein [Pseudonocardia sp. GCM10023141]|uniref:DUF222 domain-containing protein n=1 Tax=Pseudonocardia sp. GCM10023141 TaxID=3252653 RepID=UPI003608F117